jgi:plastocyanin
MNRIIPTIVVLTLIALLTVAAGCVSPGGNVTTPTATPTATTATPSPTATALTATPTATATTTTATPTPTATATATPTATTATPTPTATGGGGQSVTIGLAAHNIAYNVSTITVPAGAQVTVDFDNEDSGIPHNFAVYDSPAAQTVIFKGQIITGPATTTYTFTAPSTPGTYFFRCDVHPTIMTGQFIVQ